MAPPANRQTRPRPSLWGDHVMRAFVVLAGEHGTASLTMHQLGETLGVEAMSPYNT
jgi:hypothetical protein